MIDLPVTDETIDNAPRRRLRGLAYLHADHHLRPFGV
jgi:hypothetical protein